MRNFEDVQRDYHFSYSGADCRVYVSEGNGSKVSSLASLSTASVSVHEAKAPVRALGRRNVVGFTESIRTIAGSLVFVLVNDHPLGHLHNQGVVNENWSKDRINQQSLSYTQKQLSTLLNPINLYFVYRTEISKQNKQGEMWIKGVRFINEGIVTSVNDMVTEIVMQFVAEDVVPFKETDVLAAIGPPEIQELEESIEDILEAALIDLPRSKPALEVDEELTLEKASNLTNEKVNPPQPMPMENEIENIYLRKYMFTL